MKKIKAFVTNHGHMDIEWYMPLDYFKTFVIETAEILIDADKNKPEYVNYILDGAVYPLEEVIEDKPQYEKKLKMLVKKGKLSIGPFYTQFDEWLPSGETIATNCLWGNRRAKKFGRVMKAGQLLDNFGHSFQMPQILNNFGIKTLLFTRGMNEHEDDSKEFIWIGADGTKLYASNFCYNNAFNIYANNNPGAGAIRTLPYHSENYGSYEGLKYISQHRDKENVAWQLINNVKANSVYYPSGVVPCFIGCDHCPPQTDIPDTIAYANSVQDEVEFVMGDGEGYSGELLKQKGLKCYQEELFGTYNDFVLFGANTTRNYLKMLNFGAEIQMEKYALPLSAISEWYGKEDGDKEALRDAYKKLLINSTHDSIHGSSLDQVHVEMEYRYSSIMQRCTTVVYNALKYIETKKHLTNGDLLIFSPASGVQKCFVWLAAEGRKVKIYKDGIELPVYVHKREALPLNTLGQKYFDYRIDGRLNKVEFLCDLKANEISTLSYEILDENIQEVNNNRHYIENEFIKVSLNAGQIQIKDKKTGRIYNNLNVLEECADAGDVWDYSPTIVHSPVQIFNKLQGQRTYVECDDLSQNLILEGYLNLPIDLVGDFRNKQLVKTPVKFTFTVTKNICRVDVKMEIDNKSKDHRLRLKMHFDEEYEHILSQSIYCTTKRDVQRPIPKKAWMTTPTPYLPFREWLAVEKDGQGLAVAVKGLYEYEAKQVDGGGTDIFITLLRCTGIMNKTNMVVRGTAPGSGIEIPDAQCLRKHTFEWSYIPFKKEVVDEMPFISLVERFLYPPIVHEVKDIFENKRNDDELKDSSPIQPFDVKGNGIRVSVFKRTYDNKAFILRFFENQGNNTSVAISVKDFKNVYLSNMNEKRIKKLQIHDGIINLNVKKFKIITLLLEK